MVGVLGESFGSTRMGGLYDWFFPITLFRCFHLYFHFNQNRLLKKIKKSGSLNHFINIFEPPKIINVMIPSRDICKVNKIGDVILSPTKTLKMPNIYLNLK